MNPRCCGNPSFRTNPGIRGICWIWKPGLRSGIKSIVAIKAAKPAHNRTSWRESLPQQLDRLAEILQISAILEELEGCQGYHRLILIPHKDLHRLPLHALFFNSDGFPQSCAITYLPSAAFGLSRLDANPSNFMGSIGEEESFQPLTKNPPNPMALLRGGFSVLYSVSKIPSLIKDKDGSHKPLAALPAADIESEIISRMFPDTTRLGESDATKSAVIAALQQSHAVMHFTGHGYYEFADPLASALFLSGGIHSRLRILST